MAQSAMQMTTTAATSGMALNERQRAYSESPARRHGGLDTGARGWRWVVATPAARSSHAAGQR